MIASSSISQAHHTSTPRHHVGEPQRYRDTEDSDVLNGGAVARIDPQAVDLDRTEAGTR